MASQNLPAEWADADQIPGFDLHDKRALEEVPFRVFRVQWTVNKQGVRRAILSVERIDGERIQFQDSSTTGVCQQMKDYITDLGKGDAIDSGDPVAVNLVCPRGLRVSEYFTTVRGKDQMARSHYLTASGLLKDEPPAAKPTAKPQTPRKAAVGTRKRA